MLNSSKYGRGIGNDPMYLWLAGLGRYAASRQWRVSRSRGYTLTLGQTLIVLVFVLFFTGTSGLSCYIRPTGRDPVGRDADFVQ